MEFGILTENHFTFVDVRGLLGPEDIAHFIRNGTDGFDVEVDGDTIVIERLDDER